jgi:hypothetical protein
VRLLHLGKPFRIGRRRLAQSDPRKVLFQPRRFFAHAAPLDRRSRRRNRKIRHAAAIMLG